MSDDITIITGGSIQLSAEATIRAPGIKIDPGFVYMGKIAPPEPAPDTILVVLIRPEGPHHVAPAQACRLLETSVDHLSTLQSARAVLSTQRIGTLILEDMLFSDLPKPVQDALRPAMDGVSCPIVTRWTNPDPNA